MTSIKPEPIINLEKEIITGELDTTETPARYLGYLARIRPIFISSSRYLAYTSDVGEAARPAVHQNWVKAAYGVSWIYLLGDVGYEGYKARLRAVKYCPEDQGTVIGLGVAKRALFQGTASMLFPALTIHSVVRYSAIGISKSKLKPGLLKTWSPSILGLACIPALPFLFDEPVEKVVDSGFDWIEDRYFGDREDIRRGLNGHDAKKEE